MPGRFARVLLTGLLTLACAASTEAAVPTADGQGEQAAPAKGAAAQAVGKSVSSVGDAVETIRKAADAQGDISPHTRRALPQDVNEQAQPSGAAARPAEPKRTAKAIYGDIIIHK
jgi:hypothetical protein